MSSKLSGVYISPTEVPGSVATVAPTPQLEQGTLSPLQHCSPAQPPAELSSGPLNTTPRLPLQELDPHEVSQRLFHSPAPLSQGVLDTPYLTSPTLLSRQGLSPSSLLLTQHPLDSHISPNRPTVREMRQQLNNERQIAELQQQVEALGNMVTANHFRNNASDRSLQRKIDEMNAEKEELLEALEERDQKLFIIHNSLASLNREYMLDIEKLKGVCKKLTEDVKEAEESRRSLQSNLVLEKEKYSNLESEYKESLKSLRKLKTFMSTLPAPEELETLKTQISSEKDAKGEVEIRCSKLEELSELARIEVSETKDKNLMLESQVKELTDINVELQRKVSNMEKRRIEARSLTETDVESLLMEREDLRSENEKLRKLGECNLKKFKDERNRLERQVKQSSNLAGDATLKLKDTLLELQRAKIDNNILEVKIKHKDSENVTALSEVSRLGKEVSHLSAQKEGTSQLDGQYCRMARLMVECVAKFSNLNELIDQVIDGNGDPNVSLLLGLREVDSSRTSTILSRDLGALDTIDEKLRLLGAQEKEIRVVRQKTEELRKKIEERYADKLSNANSCTTQ